MTTFSNRSGHGRSAWIARRVSDALILAAAIALALPLIVPFA